MANKVEIVKEAERLYALIEDVRNDKERAVDRIIGFLTAFEHDLLDDKYESRGFPSSMWDR